MQVNEIGFREQWYGQNGNGNPGKEVYTGKDEGGRVSVDKTTELPGFPGHWLLWQTQVIGTRWQRM